MAASVKTNAFLLGEATLMLDAYSSAASVFDLVPADHSIGMVRGVALTKENDKIDLRKGVRQLLVDSQESNVRTMLSAEVFEFNARNLYYSLSQAKTAAAVKRGVLKTTATGPQATITVNSDPIPGESGSAIAAVGDIPNGATLLIQRLGAENDYVLPVRVTAVTTVVGSDYTVTAAVPSGVSFPAGSRVWIVNEIGVGTTEVQDFFKVKLVATLSNNERPITIVIPKAKILKGFNMNFDEGNYTSMPFEFDPYFLTSSEVSGRLAEIGTTKQIHVYAAN